MRLVNPAEILGRYNWYVDVLENEPDSALSKALNEATDYNDRPTDSLTITLTWEQWESMRYWLQYGTDYHMAKRAEWLAAFNMGRKFIGIERDPKMYAKAAAWIKENEEKPEQMDLFVMGGINPVPKGCSAALWPF